ncbi:hypothetical protein [uncultured Nitrosomonas sp.]|uniref:hypothetical protein n=1 Tax=uncultured Nitrosomonas sp. TaxID=156424 RepID=UPI0025EA7ACB|nr:hypothetical protein [uncultured Nitrosomonas sp.]
MIKQIIQSSVTAFIFFAILDIGAVSAHGKVSLEHDNCLRGAEGSRVHFSTYQPQYDPEAEYCSEIPETGLTFWVIDLIDQSLRDMPIGIQIVKGSGKTLSEKVVASFYSINHQDGVISGESNLDEGLYTVFITGEGVPPVQYEYPLRVKIDGFFSDSRFSYSTGPMIALLLLALMLFAHKLMKPKQISR